MKPSRALIVAFWVIVAVISASAQNAAPPRVPGIDTAGMDRSVRPQDDFFRFVNGARADKTPIPADRSNYGTFAELGERAQEAVRGILEAEAIKPGAPGSIGQKVGISHGFDDQGRKSDGDGNLRDWWTSDDAKKFEERAAN